MFIQYIIRPGPVHPKMHATDAAMNDAAPRVPLGPPERCPYCHAGVELVTGAEVYPERPELADRHIWRCTQCDASVGCHRAGATVRRGGAIEVSDGTLPMGSLANGELRAARTETHRLFDGLLQPPTRMSRSEAYSWMARFLGIPVEEAHIACLSYDECVKVQLAIEDLVRPPGEKPDLPGAAHWLLQAGIEFTVEADGHYLVKTGEGLVDYWPDRQTWKIRGELLAEEQEGFHGLVVFCRYRG